MWKICFEKKAERNNFVTGEEKWVLEKKGKGPV